MFQFNRTVRLSFFLAWHMECALPDLFFLLFIFYYVFVVTGIHLVLFCVLNTPCPVLYTRILITDTAFIIKFNGVFIFITLILLEFAGSPATYELLSATRVTDAAHG